MNDFAETGHCQSAFPLHGSLYPAACPSLVEARLSYTVNTMVQSFYQEAL